MKLLTAIFFASFAIATQLYVSPDTDVLRQEYEAELGSNLWSDRIVDFWSDSDSGALPLHPVGSPTILDASARLMSSQVPKLQVVGLFDTGTNLLNALLRLNFGREVLQDACAYILEFERNHSGGCYFWKHTQPRDLPSRVMELSIHGKVLVLAMVRSPLALIQSFVKEAYNLRPCVRAIDWQNYSELECRMMPSRSLTETFAGLTGVWNSYMRAYHSLQSAAGPNVQVLMVEYERLVLDPESVMREVAQSMGLHWSGPFRGVEVAAKRHGRAHGRDFALDDVINMRYLEKEPMSNATLRAALCQHLDASLMAAHSVPISTPRTYAADCL